MRTIQIGPRTWQEHVDLLLVIIERGDAKGRSTARAELMRMAHLADLYVASAEADAEETRSLGVSTTE